MKMIIQRLKSIAGTLSKTPIQIAIVVALVVVVFSFANPISLFMGWSSHLFGSSVGEGGGSVITGVKMTGELKPIKRFVGGFLEVPTDTPANKELRERGVKVIYQWEGSAEFLVDLEKVSVEEVGSDSVVLHMPEMRIDNYRELPFDNKNEQRLYIAYGDKNEVEKIKFSMEKLVAAKMEKMLDTKENWKAAREQTELLLRAMINVASNKNVEFDWGEK